MNRLEEIYEEGREYLGGDKRFEWLEKLAGQPSGYGNFSDPSGSFIEHIGKGKELLAPLRRAGGSRIQLIKQWSDEEGFEKIRTLMHMLYLLREFEWAEEFFDRQERKILWDFNTIIGNLAYNKATTLIREGVGKIFDRLSDENADWLSASLLWHGPYADAVDRTIGRMGVSTTFYVTAIDRNIDNEGNFEIVRRNFDIDDETLHAIGAGDECLEIGPGFSDFAVKMRGNGKTIWTVDLHTMEDLLAELSRMESEGSLGILTNPDGALEFLKYMQENLDEMRKWHVTTSSHESGIAELGSSRFHSIFANDSIFQVYAYAVSTANPSYFLQSVTSILDALCPDGGTFYATTQAHWHLYSGKRMSRFMLPYIMSLLAGGFEIVGANDARGDFSWDEFIKKHIVRRSPDKTRRNTFVVRRLPHSRIEDMAEFVNRFLPLRDEKDALASVCRSWPHG